MTKDDVELIVAALKSGEEEKKNPNRNVIAAIAIGVAIAVGGNFVGWFATKSTSDVENVTRINQTLEFMGTQRKQADETLTADIKELKESLEQAVQKIEERLDDQFTREDFNREMIYRDQDVKRIQNQVEEMFDKIDEIHARP